MRPHLLVLVLALVLSLHSAAAFFQHTHDCGDGETRQHVLKACKNALWKLDSLIPPSVDEAIDHHNVRNFNAALNSPTLKAAKKDANQCAMCVLHGFTNCDIKLHDSGCGTPGLVHEEHAFGFTDLSQNCKDHVSSRNKLKDGYGPAFRMHEIQIEGTHTLKAQPAAVQWTDDFAFAETAPAAPGAGAAGPAKVKDVTTFVAPKGLLNPESADPVGDWRLDPTLLDDYKVSNIMADRDAREAAARDQTIARPVTTEAAKPAGTKELNEPDRPFYICALVNDTKQVDLTCPPGMKIKEITYASYGTPLRRFVETALQKLNQSGADPSVIAAVAEAVKSVSLQQNEGDLALAETIAATPAVQEAIAQSKELTQNGYVLFSGDKCYEAAFQTRDECSAYNSRDVVEFACKGSSKCTLRATGDPKVFPKTFQRLTCDDQLKLYVKAACVSAESMAAAEAQTTAELIRNWDIEVHKEVMLDFNDPNQMDFLPGVVDAKEQEATSISRAEDKFAVYKNDDGVIQRPIVREQINPPTDYFPNFILTGTGQSSFRCEDSGIRDADGTIYIWRPNGAEPRNTWMRYYDEDNRMVAEWDLESNTYKWLADGSTVVPEQFPVGEVTDTGATDGVQNHVENAPDQLYHMQTSTGSGMFSGIKYIQRYQSRQGVPPKEDGIVVLTDNKQWFRCKNGQQLTEQIVQMTGTYFFYTQDAHYAEKGRGAPYWVWIVVGVGAALFVTLIAGAVYWKVKGAPKFISRKKAYEGSYDKTSDAANRLQRTLLYGEDESGDMMAQTEAL